MSFYHEIKQQLEAEDPEGEINREQNRDYFQRAVKGSEEDVHRFITNNMRLVTTAVERFMKRHRASTYLVDDMFSEGLLTLTRAVRTLVKQLSVDEEKFQQGLASFVSDPGETDLNVIMYIYISAYRAIQLLYEFDSSDAISARVRDQHTPEGHDEPTGKVDLQGFDFDYLPCDPFSEIFYLEDIMDSCTTDDERFIVEQRLHGYLDREIANEMGCKRANVTQIKTRVYRRFCREAGIDYVESR